MEVNVIKIKDESSDQEDPEADGQDVDSVDS